MEIKNLNESEKKILRLMQEDAGLSVNEIAAKTNMSVTPCWKRIKRMEQAGIIRKKVVLVDANLVNIPTSVFVSVQTKNHCRKWQDEFTQTVMTFPEVMEFYRMSGSTDYLMRVQVTNIQAFDEFYQRLIDSVEGLTNVTSTFAMEQIKYTTALPL